MTWQLAGVCAYWFVLERGEKKLCCKNKWKSLLQQGHWEVHRERQACVLCSQKHHISNKQILLNCKGSHPTAPHWDQGVAVLGHLGPSTMGTVIQVMISTFFWTPAVPIILQKASSQVTSTWNHLCSVLTPFHAYPQETSLCGRESSLSLSDLHLMADLFTETARRKLW